MTKLNTGRVDWDAAISVVDGLIPEGEPIFIIRAQDISSGAVVRAWADAALGHGADPSIVDQVRRHAARMDLWPVKKVPDAPMTEAAQKRAAYEALRAGRAI